MRFFFILLINAIIFTGLYFVADFIIKKDFFENLEWDIKANVGVKSFDETKSELYPDYFVRIEQTEEAYKEFCGEDRSKINPEFTKNPVVIFGCSYAYGHGLKKEETLPYLISKYTNRPVYNYSGCGEHILSTMGWLDTDMQGEYGDKLKNADYVIYLYMHDHMNRYTRFAPGYYEEIFSPGLIERNIVKLNVFDVILSKIRLLKVYKEFPDTKYSVIFLKKVLVYSIKQIKQTAPHAKIIFIIYDEKIPSNDKNNAFDNAVAKYAYDIMNDEMWNELEKEYGIKVVHTKDITGFMYDKNYKLDADIADWHPNSKAWAVFTPKFVKEYITD